MGKIGPVPSISTPSRKVRVPGPRVAAQNRPYFVVVLVLGTTKPCGLRLVWAVFRSQRHPPEVVLTGPNASDHQNCLRAARQSLGPNAEVIRCGYFVDAISLRAIVITRVQGIKDNK